MKFSNNPRQFGNILTKGFGFSLFSTLLLQIPAGAAQIVFVCIGCIKPSHPHYIINANKVFSAYFGTYVKNARLLTMVFFMLVRQARFLNFSKRPAPKNS